MPLLTVLFLSLIVQTALAEEPALLQTMRYGEHPGYLRVVFEMDRPAPAKISKAGTSLRILFSQTRLAPTFQRATLPPFSRKNLIKTVDIQSNENLAVEVILTPQGEGPPRYRTLVLENPDRFVVDMLTDTPHAVPTPATLIQTLVIDPGHGGHDPGAIGHKIEEKEVALDIALRLQSLIQKQTPTQVFMTRKTDTFIPLPERVTFASSHSADLFLSIHVNAHESPAVRGSETYLFGRAADSSAIATAARENATSEQATLNFQEKILTDMARDWIQNASLELAHYTQEALAKQIATRYATASLGVKRAPFYVLAKTDMPAILIEIAFVSHPEEARLLKTGDYRQAMAEAIFEGVRAYIQSLEKNP